ncbi:hypothetical protein AYO20_10203 [Fonsecaea nubica]|uniref:endo-1,3(4)-beta-glucanase n=1 Tax=Fonsecaea nubica TaxID=856822 RepID=A0A178C880_9EURO|nr:hypothetical protein AYO20_10203 [Fonsecaea nubica]OAL26150.1 hypothetical protein AYO20_10203 [Fonsecaea nubica]
MNSTLNEGESFLRDEDHGVPEDENGQESGAQDDHDVPDIVPAEPHELAEGATETLDAVLEDENGESGQIDGEIASDGPGTNGTDNIPPFDEATNLLSIDDSASIPDDTPSVQDSVLSSPRSDAGSVRSPGRRGSPSTIHRPFDIRFQSRLSSSQLSPLRSSSPAFLNAHSRHASAASHGLHTPSEPDETINPWDVIRWSKFRKITGQAFSEIGKRNFGSPICLAVADQLVLGTSKGIVLVFDHHQNHKAIIGSGTKAAESGAVTALAISADHTTIAVGHETGHIFTWELARPSRPFLHIQPIEASQPQARKGDGHISDSAVLHIGFLGYRHTALVSADDKGMAFSHLATRGMGAVGRVVRTTRILGRYPELVSRSSKPLKKSSVLAFSPLPLGNIEQRTDSLGLVAMLTPYLLVIVSTTPVAQTQHKAARPKEVAAHSAMTAALAWFPAIKLKSQDSETSKTKLVYAWSNILTVLEVHGTQGDDDTEKNKPPDLQFLARSRYQADEAIVAVQWLNRSVLAVLTITQQLLIIEDLTMHVTEAFDLLKKNIYHADLYSQQLRAIIEQLDEEDTSMHGVVADAFHMSFRAYKGRLFLLGFNDVWTGVLTNWADRLLAMINVGDFIGAIRLATKYYQGEGEKATIGLPEEDNVRAGVVKEKLVEMMSASLKYAFGKNQQAGSDQIEKPQMAELADACIKACLVMEDEDFLFEEVFSWYEEHEQGHLFVDVLEPYILDQTISSVPPPALKTLINHFVQTHTPSVLEEIICMLDTSTMDIDQVTTLCKQYALYDAYIYVWTMALQDFTTPLMLLLELANNEDPPRQRQQVVNMVDRYNIAQKIFPYMSFILTGRVYPTGNMLGEEASVLAKGQVYDYFFSGSSGANGVAQRRSNSFLNPTVSFENLSRVLHFDTASFIAALNEAFEDSYLNLGDDDVLNSLSLKQAAATHTYTRQYVVRILLEVMSSGFDSDDTIYLDMFIARNLAKYPQYLVLSGTVLQEIFIRLCQYPEDDMQEDAELSIEYLLSVYQPPNVLDFVPLLREARFYRVLKSVFKQERQYADMISTFFVDSQDRVGVFASIVECLRLESPLAQRQRQEVRDVIQKHALDLINIDVQRCASTIDEVAPDLHHVFLQTMADDLSEQFEYLRTLLEPEEHLSSRRNYDHEIMELYVRLLCRFDPSHVRDYVENIKEGDIRLAEVLPTIEDNGIIDAVVILQVRQGQVKDAMDRLTRHLALLGSTLKSLKSDLVDQEDDSSVIHPATNVLESLEKYTRVGIWLCQGQMKNAPKSLAVAKSPRRSASANRALSFQENLWLELILSVVSIARDVSIHALVNEQTHEDPTGLEITQALRTTIQQVFTALLTSTTSMRDGASGRDMMFLRILRAFLSHAAEASPSLSELRNVISSIFAAYAYEESLLGLSNSMLDKDVFVRLDEVAGLRQRGWRPRGQVCEVCRRRIWGPGVGERVWEQWQKREEGRLLRRRRTQDNESVVEDDETRGKGKATVGVSSQEPLESEGGGAGTDLAEELGPIVAFSCRHLYHQKCLGQPRMEDGVPQLDPDPTNGYVQYVDQNTAQRGGLINTDSGAVYMGVDHTNVASGSGRQSVRLTSKKSYNHGLIILDLSHMPGGICGAWPAFWTVGPNWPNAGEIDIIEGVNLQTSNAMTLHTNAGCSISNNGMFSGSVATSNCDIKAAGQATNAGCSISTPNDATYGTGFNDAEGGVYATEWTSSAINIWFFSRSAIPSDISSGSPDPGNWGQPLASFGGSCNIDEFFNNQQIVFDTTFCGDWAGNVWDSDPVCKSKASTCESYVQNNPSAFQDAFWTVNSLKVFQGSGSQGPNATAPFPSFSSHAPTASVSIPGGPPGPPPVGPTQTSFYSAPTTGFSRGGNGRHTKTFGTYEATAANFVAVPTTASVAAASSAASFDGQVSSMTVGPPVVAVVSSDGTISDAQESGASPPATTPTPPAGSSDNNEKNNAAAPAAVTCTTVSALGYKDFQSWDGDKKSRREAGPEPGILSSSAETLPFLDEAHAKRHLSRHGRRDIHRHLFRHGAAAAGPGSEE